VYKEILIEVSFIINEKDSIINVDSTKWHHHIRLYPKTPKPEEERAMHRVPNPFPYSHILKKNKTVKKSNYQP